MLCILETLLQIDCIRVYCSGQHRIQSQYLQQISGVRVSPVVSMLFGKLDYLIWHVQFPPDGLPLFGETGAHRRISEIPFGFASFYTTFQDGVGGFPASRDRLDSAETCLHKHQESVLLSVVCDRVCTSVAAQMRFAMKKALYSYQACYLCMKTNFPLSLPLSLACARAPGQTMIKGNTVWSAGRHVFLVKSIVGQCDGILEIRLSDHGRRIWQKARPSP